MKEAEHSILGAIFDEAYLIVRVFGWLLEVVNVPINIEVVRYSLLFPNSVPVSTLSASFVVWQI